jgi:hypothetical protein
MLASPVLPPMRMLILSALPRTIAPGKKKIRNRSLFVSVFSYALSLSSLFDRAYLAPELWGDSPEETQGFSTKSDIYAMAIVMWVSIFF